MNKKILVLLLLFPVIISASSHKRLDSLRMAVFRQCGLPNSGNLLITPAAANQYINIAIQRVSSDFPAVEKAAAIVCSDGVASYAMDTTFDRLRWCRIWKYEDSILYPIRVVDGDSLWEMTMRGKTAPEKIEQPEPAYVYSWGKTIFVHPVPQYADTLHYGFYAIGRNLTSNADTTDVREAFRDLIIILASAYIARDLENYTASESFFNQYIRRMK